MRVLGLDVGDRRTGVALSDPLGMLASPLLVFELKNGVEDIAFILKLVEQYQVEKIIIGLPQSMDGSIGSQAEKVKIFSEKLRHTCPVPIEYRDERLTTVTAKRMLMESGNKKYTKKKKVECDAAAAAVILQSYLNEARPLEYPSED
jgi:putative holliday junction resolvase